MLQESLGFVADDIDGDEVEPQQEVPAPALVHVEDEFAGHHDAGQHQHHREEGEKEGEGEGEEPPPPLREYDAPRTFLAMAPVSIDVSPELGASQIWQIAAGETFVACGEQCVHAGTPALRAAAATICAMRGMDAAASHGVLRLRVDLAGHGAQDPWGVKIAVGETVILLHPPLPLVSVSIGTKRVCHQNDSLANG